DELFVDELLDFSHEFSEVEERPGKAEEMGEKVGKAAAAASSSPVSVSVSGSGERVDDDDDDDDDNEGNDVLLSRKNYLGSLPETGFPAPGEGLESLEWLSHFVDDSFSEFSLTGKLPPNPPEKKPTEPENSKPGFVSSQVQTKARTKRARTGIRVWPVLSPSFADSTTTSSSSSSSSTTTTTTTTTPLNRTASTAKKKQRAAAEDSAAGGAVHVQPRRCSHCGVTKTPQWRAGPMGSKTLCNACGVRFKSGRLLPEYRPACSPTFSSELHSNSHRKVLEMRRKKESE
ncbi:hypothetical protein M569_15789, partial [Genlisea aurea]